jgi:hypothetical protein
MPADLREKTVDKVIAENFPEYASMAKEVAWDSIYDNIEKLPTSAKVHKYKSGAIKIKLSAGSTGGAKDTCGIFGLKKGNDGSLLVFQNDLEAPTSGYWKRVGKFKLS